MSADLWTEEEFEIFLEQGAPPLAELRDKDFYDLSWKQLRRLTVHYRLNIIGTASQLVAGIKLRRDRALARLEKSTTTPSAATKETADPAATDEEAQRLSAKRQVEESDKEEEHVDVETQAPAPSAPMHRREQRELDARIEELQRLQRELLTQYELLRTPDTAKQADSHELQRQRDASNDAATSSGTNDGRDDRKHEGTVNNAGEDSQTEGGGTRYLGFYNKQHGLRSWCEDGHPDENRFRQNEWNPVWSTDSKDAILKWVAVANTPALDRISTPVDQFISQQHHTAPRPRSQFVSNIRQAWDNKKATLQLTARQLGMESGAMDSARRILDFDVEGTTSEQQPVQEQIDFTSELREQDMDAPADGGFGLENDGEFDLKIDGDRCGESTKSSLIP